MNFHEVLQHVTSIITDECNCARLRMFTKEEICAALKHMHPCKAPDSMHVIFYQCFRHVVDDDVSEFISSILHGFSSPAGVNKTNIALIPKVKELTKVVEFRPIALCNAFYKLVSNAIVIRLKEFFPYIVKENQSAFVPGCLITDNTLLWKIFIL